MEENTTKCTGGIRFFLLFCLICTNMSSFNHRPLAEKQIRSELLHLSLNDDTSTKEGVAGEPNHSSGMGKRGVKRGGYMCGRVSRYFLG